MASTLRESGLRGRKIARDRSGSFSRSSELSSVRDMPAWSRASPKAFLSEEYMQSVSGMDTDVFGLYELSRDGTILYSRPRREDGLRDPEQAIIGQDFFRDIFPCANMEDLRRHFRRFIMGDQSVDTFVFECLFDREVVRTKIFMTRAYENDHDHAGGIVIMDIRRAS